jgi:hypothetical protein
MNYSQSISIESNVLILIHFFLIGSFSLKNNIDYLKNNTHNKNKVDIIRTKKAKSSYDHETSLCKYIASDDTVIITRDNK